MSKRLLIADDEQGILDALAMRLEDEGFECITTTDGADACRKIRSEVPDLVLLDIIMPGVTGWQVAERMLADADTAQIPFIFLTAVDQVADEVRGLQMGAVEFIVKPFDFALVVQTIRAALAGEGIMSASDRVQRIDALTARSKATSVIRERAGSVVRPVGREHGVRQFPKRKS